MKTVAVLGGGFAGLSAAYYARKKGFKVAVFEKDSILGGLAQGFEGNNWDWPLERAYHHIFTTDSDILQLATDIGFDDLLTLSPNTSSLYNVDGDYKIHAINSPTDLLRFPYISIPDRLRVGAALALFKYGPFLNAYEKQTAFTLGKAWMGEKGWEAIFGEIFRKKFGKYADDVLAIFMWARIKARTPQLLYVKNGFQHFIDTIGKKLQEDGVTIQKNTIITDIVDKEGMLEVSFVNRSSQRFDYVISTLPSPIISRVGKSILSEKETKGFTKLQYLDAFTLILETKQPILQDVYWLSVCDPSFPALALIQHTNFVEKKHYNTNHLLYVASYLDKNDPFMQMEKQEMIKTFMPYLKKLSVSKIKIVDSYLFKAPFAQPIFSKAFLENKPSFRTSHPQLLIANMDMTYPYDRGTNYAVKVGKDVVQFLNP